MSSKQFSWIEEIGHLVKGFYYQNQSHVTDSPLKGYNNAIEKVSMKRDKKKGERDSRALCYFVLISDILQIQAPIAAL